MFEIFLLHMLRHVKNIRRVLVSQRWRHVCVLTPFPHPLAFPQSNTDFTFSTTPLLHCLLYHLLTEKLCLWLWHKIIVCTIVCFTLVTWSFTANHPASCNILSFPFTRPQSAYCYSTFLSLLCKSYNNQNSRPLILLALNSVLLSTFIFHDVVEGNVVAKLL